MSRALALACALAGLGVPAGIGAQGALPLEGVIDAHSHMAPGSRGPRSVNAFEAARLARASGMRAMVIKNHYTETASQAYLASLAEPGVEIYGGIVLNRSVGGINLAAVENMTRMTGALGRIVWLPTFDSENNAPDTDNVPISRNGALLPEVGRLFALMRVHDLALATGHVRPEEVLLAIRGARAAGIERIVVTHPTSALVGMSVTQQREAAALGALLEFTVNSALADESFARLVSEIRAVGPDNVVLTSDLGQPENPPPAEGLQRIVPRLEGAGFTRAEIDRMMKVNPARLLGLE